MDIPCVITHRQRCTRRTRPAAAPPLRRLLLESPSPSTLCWPRRRARAAAPPRLGAQINTTQQPRLCRSLGTPAWPSQQPRHQQPRTSTHRPCCTLPPTCSLDIRSTAAHLSATSRHVEAPFTHKVKPRFPRCNRLVLLKICVFFAGLNLHFCTFLASMSKVNAGMHSFKTKGGKSKRIRTSFTSEQLSRLEKEFARQQYMVGSERFLLASALQLSEAQVRKQISN